MMSRIFPFFPRVVRPTDARSFSGRLRPGRRPGSWLLCGAVILTGALCNLKAEEESVDPSSAEYRRSAERERYFRKAEVEFTNRDLNGNLVIDEEEWGPILEEHRAKMPASFSPERVSEMDLDKDGTVSESEIDAAIKRAFQKRVKPYTGSEIYKQRKAEYEKTN
jgi:hypothetical protein